MSNAPSPGRPEIRAAYATGRSLFWWAAVFSVVVNLLMLTSPLYMMQVYDRVLASQSVPTLVVLSILMGFLFLFMGTIDYLRGRILARAGARFQTVLDDRVMRAALRRALNPRDRERPNMAAKDLESIQQFLSSPAPFAFFDAPWTPVYLGALFLFHWQMGVFALAAGVVLVFVALLNEFTTRGPEHEARRASAEAEDQAETMRRESEIVHALGMGDAGMGKWTATRSDALSAQIKHSDRAGAWQTFSKTFRMFIQSAILGIGAWLAIQGEISPGSMIAGSILMGRALAPIDQAINQWKLFLRARRGSQSLTNFLKATPPPAAHIPLPEPRSHLEVSELIATPMGARNPVLRGVSFSVGPGEVVGIIGPSASGKSTLARVLAGLYPPTSGQVRLDGAALDQWDPSQLGASIGYLPQEVGLFSANVAENIARLSHAPDPEKVVEAARRAGAHEVILKLQDGYEARVGIGGAHLSGGQRQRIGLARALYGDPALILLDEPNSNLDAEGESALVGAITDAKARGKAVVVMAHRPSAISVCDRLLLLSEGRPVAYGPKDEVLRQTTQNHARLAAHSELRKTGT